jgi:predicted protein tyrosine phosphatase
MRLKTTKTDQIFADTAPYSNDSQTNSTRLLFVCSAGMLRSPTAANAATSLGYNSRACGSHNYALIPLSVNLINWANAIIFVKEENLLEALETFEGTGYNDDILTKSQIWNLPDIYNWGDNVLFHTCLDKLKRLKLYT